MCLKLGRSGNEPLEKAIEAFLKEGLLRVANLQEKMDAKFKLTDLKPLLKTRNLPVTGKKNLLIDRLIQADREAIESLVTDVNVLICSDKGKLIAEDYLKKNGKLGLQQKRQSFLL
ncbi:MAG: SAP domain-containing protein [Methanolinea sp.]|nr:MAG: SAP domain-containing protein [Methanolinea sp.]